jgi:hypothetical protein
MRKRIIAYAAVALVIVAATTASAERTRARSASSGVFYHDQSGTALNGANAASARQLASARLAFTVGLPTRWPAGTALRALWVMDHHTPRFAVLYYGGDGGYIACQLHESLAGTSVSLGWATRKPITVGAVQGALLQSNIGGANPVSEIVWRLHGVRYDLLGSTGTSVATVLDMAASVA